MKNMKKLANLLLALVMVLSLATTAFAAENNGKITINNAVVGQTYSVYKMFDLESYSTTNSAYSYKVNSAWSGFFAEGKDGLSYVNIDDQGYVTWKDNASAADFAAKAIAYAKANSIASSAEPIKATATTVTFSNLDLGYYLVDSTLGALCSLDTTNPNVTIKEKNTPPTITKEVQEGETWGETNDADINQVVNFKATITVQAGAENYVLHDTMSAGLTYTGVTSVKIGDTAVDAANYTVTTPGTCACTFEVAFKDEYIADLAADTQIVVEYSAKLNENAVVGLDGNTNKVKLEYGDENKPSYTPEDTTITYTWDAKVIKYTMNGEEEVKLAGATFELSTSADEGYAKLKFRNLGENKYEHCADADCSETHVTEITTDATGTFNIEGLDAGTYYLHETAAPAGYNKLAGPVTVTITGATKGEDDTLTYSTVETKVENNAGSELPSTGGMGTTLFYTIGGLMMLAAVVLLATKKRMSIAE